MYLLKFSFSAKPVPFHAKWYLLHICILLTRKYRASLLFIIFLTEGRLWIVSIAKLSFGWVNDLRDCKPKEDRHWNHSMLQVLGGMETMNCWRTKLSWILYHNTNVLKLDSRINKSNLTSFYLSFVCDFYLVSAERTSLVVGKLKVIFFFSTPIISWLFSIETCCGHAAKEKNR